MRNPKDITYSQHFRICNILGISPTDPVRFWFWKHGFIKNHYIKNHCEKENSRSFNS